MRDVVGGRTGSHAARIANKSNAHVLAASYCATTAFEQLGPEQRRVLFQVHPHPRFLRDLYLAQMEVDPIFSGLAKEFEVVVSEQDLRDWEKESKLADHILCASHFTRRSLEANGIPPGNISVLPYGIDTNVFHPGDPIPGDKLTVLYVGQKVARKGLRMLLSVWRNLNPQDAHLVLAGGHVRDEDELRGYGDLYTEMSRVSNGDLVKLYQGADLFVLPSLAEGFGHVLPGGPRLRRAGHLHGQHGRGRHHPAWRKRVGVACRRFRSVERVSGVGVLAPPGIAGDAPRGQECCGKILLAKFSPESSRCPAFAGSRSKRFEV